MTLYAFALGVLYLKVSLINFSTKKTEIWNFHNIVWKTKKGRITFREASDSYPSKNTVLFQAPQKL